MDNLENCLQFLYKFSCNFYTGTIGYSNTKFKSDFFSQKTLFKIILVNTKFSEFPKCFPYVVSADPLVTALETVLHLDTTQSNGLEKKSGSTTPKPTSWLKYARQELKIFLRSDKAPGERIFQDEVLVFETTNAEIGELGWRPWASTLSQAGENSQQILNSSTKYEWVDEQPGQSSSDDINDVSTVTTVDLENSPAFADEGVAVTTPLKFRQFSKRVSYVYGKEHLAYKDYDETHPLDSPSITGSSHSLQSSQRVAVSATTTENSTLHGISPKISSYRGPILSCRNGMLINAWKENLGFVTQLWGLLKLDATEYGGKERDRDDQASERAEEGLEASKRADQASKLRKHSSKRRHARDLESAATAAALMGTITSPPRGSLPLHHRRSSVLVEAIPEDLRERYLRYLTKTSQQKRRILVEAVKRRAWEKKIAARYQSLSQRKTTTSIVFIQLD